MKTILVLAAGAVLGVALHYILELGLGKWLAVAALFGLSALLFREYVTRPGVKRGRK
jgi:hypothetical protein